MPLRSIRTHRGFRLFGLTCDHPWHPWHRCALIVSLCLLGLLIGLGLYSVRAHRAAAEEASRTVTVNTRLGLYLEAVQGGLGRLQTAFILGLTGASADAEALYAENRDLISKQVAQLGGLQGELGELGAPLEALLPKLTQLEAQAQRLFEIENEDGFQEQSIEDDAVYLNTSLSEAREQIQALQRLNHRELVQGGSFIHQKIVRGTWSLMLLLLVGVVWILWIFYLYVSRVLQPLNRFSQAVHRLDEGGEEALPNFQTEGLGPFAQPMHAFLSHVEGYTEKQHERAHETLSASMALVGHPLFVVDEECAIVFMNPIAQNFLQTLGENFTVPSLPASLLEAVDEVARGEADLDSRSLSGALTFNVGGTERFLLPRITRLTDEGGVLFGFTLLLEDVTDLRLIDELRSGLVSMIGHELQTPMTVVRMALHLLRQNAMKSLSEDNQTLLQAALDDTENLQTILQNLIDLNKIDTRGISLYKRPWNPARELPMLVSKFCHNHEIDPSRIRLTVEDNLPAIPIDRERMDHVFTHLLSNAFKFSPVGDGVELKAECLNEGWIRISVQDRGPGVPEEFIPKLFEPYFRVPGQGAGGAGLGLWISQLIVRMHGGRIHVESKPGEGACFRVDLEIESPDEAAEDAEDPEDWDTFE